jgi:hypothetical protein
MLIVAGLQCLLQHVVARGSAVLVLVKVVGELPVRRAMTTEFDRGCNFSRGLARLLFDTSPLVHQHSSHQTSHIHLTHQQNDSTKRRV